MCAWVQACIFIELFVGLADACNSLIVYTIFVDFSAKQNCQLFSVLMALMRSQTTISHDCFESTVWNWLTTIAVSNHFDFLNAWKYPENHRNELPFEYYNFWFSLCIWNFILWQFNSNNSGSNTPIQVCGIFSSDCSIGHFESNQKGSHCESMFIFTCFYIWLCSIVQSKEKAELIRSASAIQ